MNKTYTIIKTSRFKRDYKRLMKQGRDMTDLDAAIGKLAVEGKLPARYNDHPLKGDWVGFRECHINGPKSDWLLVYDKNENVFILQLIRTGSHQDLKIGEK